MHYIKLGFWIFILSVFYATGIFNIYGFYPELLFIFSVIYSIIAKSFRERVVTAVISGVLMSALGGYGFVFSMLVVVYSTLLFGLVFRGKLAKYTIFSVFGVFVVTFLCDGLFGLFVNGATKETLYAILIGAAVNTVFAAVLHPLIKKTFEEKERYIF